ncbi:hypothetical protein TeGR_g15130, partial [Tetraparma gracilis]
MQLSNLLLLALAPLASANQDRVPQCDIKSTTVKYQNCHATKQFYAGAFVPFRFVSVKVADSDGSNNAESLVPLSSWVEARVEAREEELEAICEPCAAENCESTWMSLSLNGYAPAEEEEEAEAEDEDAERRLEDEEEELDANLVSSCKSCFTECNK